MVGRTSIMAIIGGTFAKLGGGKFANGALSAAFVHLFNGEAIKFIKALSAEQMRKRRALEIVARVDRAIAIGRLSPNFRLSYNDAYARVLRVEQYNQFFVDKSLDILGLGLSVGAILSPPALATRLGLMALGIDIYQGDGGGIATGLTSMAKSNSVTKAIDIGYGIYQVVK